MARVVPSAAARRDLLAIREYSLDQFGGPVADAYFLGFDKAFELLAEHPLIGTEMPELGKSIRCIVHRKHRLFYQFDGATVLIVRVVHHAMDARRAIKGEAE